MGHKTFKLLRKYTKARKIDYKTAEKVYRAGNHFERSKWNHEMEVYLSGDKSSYLV